MCGICGFLQTRPTDDDPEGIVRRMTETLHHRGPDHQGVWQADGVALGHARLSILDLSAHAHQPMATPDGRFRIAFNGEIYNFSELRTELEAQGVPFSTHSDTEVLLAAFAAWGADAFRRLNGIFACAVWDQVEKRLVLARDRFGVKPLYYTQQAGAFLFASEMKAILAYPGIHPRLGLQGMHEYLYFGVPLGPSTFFDGIQTLPPGMVAVLESDGRLRMERFWDLTRIPFCGDSLPEAVGKTAALLEEAVRRQLVSDVPIGIFLSGGIDSSAVTAFAARHSTGRLDTFSVGFDFDEGVNELPRARRVAERFGTNHHEIHIEGGSLPPVVEALLRHHDQPFADAANIPLYLLARKLDGDPKVILQGDGGDELFGGYRRYAILSLYPLWKALSYARWLVPARGALRFPRLRRILDAIGQGDRGVMMAQLLTMDTPRLAALDFLSEDVRAAVLQTDAFARYKAFAAKTAHHDPLQQMLLCDSGILLPDTYLEKVDRATMAFGIEVRVPFLENDLADYILSLPSGRKVRAWDKKHLLKRALRGTVPDEVLDAPKQGFGVPFSHWLATSLHDYARAAFEADPGWFDRARILHLLEEHRRHPLDKTGYILWKALQMVLWQSMYGVSLA